MSGSPNVWRKCWCRNHRAKEAGGVAVASIVLAVEQLTKRIKRKDIIKGISFEVRAGEVFGFLGPNGAGKTTTIRMLVDLIKPTTGTVSICGVPLKDKPDEALRHVGCIVENPELYPYLTGWENLEHFARMLEGIGEARIHEVVSIVGMDQRIHDKVKTYSLGMRQRLGIAQALLGRPKLLILDEPTNGLDPQGIKEMREFIRTLAAGGISVFVSSHLLSEIQLMCDRVAIISHGSVIAVGDVQELIREPEPTVAWRFEPFEPGRQTLLECDGVSAEEPETASAGNGELRVRMSRERIPEANRRLVAAGVDVYAITVQHVTLEQLFLRLTEGETID
ncbi:MAG: ABC transporter ATP-binding protein [Paenibacillaceae bacterium]|nr:ABC transporter ATP-binding protein [Paenibacillaceae bacterium]